jgi:DNA-3-methyladenine glycosylase
LIFDFAVMVIARCFYIRSDVVTIARELLGKYLYTQVDGTTTAGIITETEAYAGETDQASHAWKGRRTDRTEVMYGAGGTAYIYLCYGVHSLFNVVTNRKEIPHAILVRGIQPAVNIEKILERLGKRKYEQGITSGPGRVSKALGIHYSQTGTDLTKKPASPNEDGIWIEDRKFDLSEYRLEVGPRIGVEYAGKDAALPYRFLVRIK